MLKIQAVKISVETKNGDYGFGCQFSSGLNIIRGNNSSGKSTLIHSIIYGLGLEEILGARNELALPYCLKTHFYEKADEKKEIVIEASTILLEIFNGRDVVTLRRVIRSDTKSPKLIEIIHGAFLTSKQNSLKVTPTFVHDPGSAQNTTAGYFKFLENFLGLKLPNVLSQTGEVKLYLQTIFAAIFVEQKKGWTDYIANIPYFRIRNAQQKIFEFILGFSTFENELARAELQQKIIEADKNWNAERSKLRAIETRFLISVSGVNHEIDIDFNPRLINISKPSERGSTNLQGYIGRLNEELKGVLKSLEIPDSKPAEKNNEAARLFEVNIAELNTFLSKYSQVEKSLGSTRQALREYQESKTEIQQDIEKNKVAQKMKALGVEEGISSALGKCPTCSQSIQDDLSIQSHEHITMSIDENLGYLNSQIYMIDSCINSQKIEIDKTEIYLEEIKSQVQKKRSLINSYRDQFSRTPNAVIEPIIKKKLALEREISDLQSSIDDVGVITERLFSISKNWSDLLVKFKNIPKNYLSPEDQSRLQNFQNYFRELANTFGYKSTKVTDIEINEEKYTPFLSSDVLKREIKSQRDIPRADIKSDSSASDFVRLIWSYLISLYKVSASNGGNHPRIIAFDEPAQHSMAIESLRKLFISFENEKELQSIIGASFDESDQVFLDSTKGLKFNLIRIEGKLIQKL